MTMNFTALGIRREMNAVLRENGLTEPTPIQEQAIPVLISGQDVIAQAQTGTGKTLAFVLPILELIDPNRPYIQALIVTPTRELALQITSEIKKLAPIVKANILSVYGGQDVERQIRKLEDGVHIVVATPGRLLDHLRRGTIQLSGVNMLVLDEADQMLHMGFLPDVETIMQQTSDKRQTLLFSATMPGPIRDLAARYMRKPVDIRIRSKKVTLDEIKQYAILTTDRGKQDLLGRLIEQYKPYLAIVFCRTKTRTRALNAALLERGFASDELHGDLSQAKREQVMKRFREAKLQILVATDVAARGLDVEGVTHVFNYDFPLDVDSYIHRIGRTGRAGQRGLAITLATPRDRVQLELLERGIGQTIEKRDDEGHQLTSGSKRNKPVSGNRDSRTTRTEGDRAPASRRGQGKGEARVSGKRSGSASPFTRKRTIQAGKSAAHGETNGQGDNRGVRQRAAAAGNSTQQRAAAAGISTQQRAAVVGKRQGTAAAGKPTSTRHGAAVAGKPGGTRRQGTAAAGKPGGNKREARRGGPRGRG